MGDSAPNAGRASPAPGDRSGASGAVGSAGNGPGSEQLSDMELAQRVARKDDQAPRALELLFLRHSEPLLRFLARSARNAGEAEDLVHDAFVRVAEKADTFRGESPFRTWLFSLALNLTRTKQRRASLEERADETIALRRPELSRPRPEADPAWSAERKELWAKVEQGIAGLADVERETFLLYWFGELPYAEISRMTGVSISAAKVRVHRALTKLGKGLGGVR